MGDTRLRSSLLKNIYTWFFENRATNTCRVLILLIQNRVQAGLEIQNMSGRKFATSYENLVASLKILVAKSIEAI